MVVTTASVSPGERGSLGHCTRSPTSPPSLASSLSLDRAHQSAMRSSVENAGRARKAEPPTSALGELGIPWGLTEELRKGMRRRPHRQSWAALSATACAAICSLSNTVTLPGHDGLVRPEVIRTRLSDDMVNPE